MNYNCLNTDSLQLIENIANGFRNYPAYAAYSIRSYAYGIRTGAHALEITRNSQLVNLLLFMPGIDGKIESVAVYGSNLRGHLNAIKSSMTIFGLPVESVEMDGGIEPFIDVHLSLESNFGLTETNYSTVQANVTKNMMQYMSMMKDFKSLIQREIIPMLSQQELYDIRDCRLNIDTIDKLATLGKKHFQCAPQKSNEVLYCLCMAIGTIIKEYDWGIMYIQQDGMCEMSTKITSLKL